MSLTGLNLSFSDLGYFDLEFYILEFKIGCELTGLSSLETWDFSDISRYQQTLTCKELIDLSCVATR